jgi:hypothetical protein
LGRSSTLPVFGVDQELETPSRLVGGNPTGWESSNWESNNWESNNLTGFDLWNIIHGLTVKLEVGERNVEN